MSGAVVFLGCSCGGDRREGDNIDLVEEMSDSVAAQGYSCGGDCREGGNVFNLVQRMSAVVAAQGCISCGGINLAKQASNHVPSHNARCCFWHPSDFIQKILNREELSPRAIARSPSHISIVMNTSLVWSMRLQCQFPSRFVELTKIVGVCYAECYAEPHLQRSQELPSSEPMPTEEGVSSSTVHAEDFKLAPVAPAEGSNVVPTEEGVSLPAVPAEDVKLVPVTPAEGSNVVPTEEGVSLPAVPAEDVKVVPPEDPSHLIDDSKPDDPSNTDLTEVAPHARGSPPHICIVMIARLMCRLTTNAG
eukprot:scaffold9300_cov168-Skeletonema_dohrnii-CCMP3373.AAC.2